MPAPAPGVPKATDATSSGGVERAQKVAIAGWSWVMAKERPSRRWLIFTLTGITLVYLVCGVLLASFDSAWKPTDWFSMITGVLFFIVGTSLAVTHEIRQENEAQILIDQQRILDKQEETLRAVRHEVNQVPDIVLAGIHLSSGERSVSLDQSPVSIEDAGTLSTSDQPLVGDELNPELSMFDAPNSAAMQRFALERSIAAGANEPVVRRLIKDTEVFGLGEPAGDTSIPGQAPESDLLHFTVDLPDGTEEVVMLPVFTRTPVLRDALLSNPEWQALSVLALNGGDLLANIDPDVRLVINPWAPDEFQLANALPGV